MFIKTEKTEDQTSSVGEVEKKTASTNESAPPGAAISEYCAANVKWVAAFHEPFACVMNDDIPDS